MKKNILRTLIILAFSVTILVFCTSYPKSNNLKISQQGCDKNETAENIKERCHITKASNIENIVPIVKQSSCSIAKENKANIAAQIGAANIDVLIAAPVTNDSDASEEKIIFLGDSRFVGMDICVDEDDAITVAEVGKGYNWLTKTGLQQVKDIVESNPNERYTIVIGLGINDLKNIDKYITLYKDLIVTYNIVFTSVNPIEYHNYITNKQIEEFNNKLISFCQENNTLYIDTYNKLISNGFSTVDGLHYSKQTYQYIYDIIKQTL